MATIIRSASLTLRDCRGFTASVHWAVSFDDSAIPAAMSAAAALAGIIAAMTWGSTWNTGGLASQGVTFLVYGSNSPFSSVGDKAVMTWKTTEGQLVKQRIPCPQSGIFLADGATVDASNVQVAAYIAAVKADGVVTKTGAAFSDFVAGHLERKKVRLRIGTTILAPALDGSDY